MTHINPYYSRLKTSYLFYRINQTVDALRRDHPQERLLLLGVGDVTLPLAPVVVEAMKKGAEELGKELEQAAGEAAKELEQAAAEALTENAKETAGKIDLEKKFKEGEEYIRGKLDEVLEKTELDEKIKEGAAVVRDKVNEFIEKSDLDEKIKEGAAELKEKVTEKFAELKEKFK